ncbi:hypothetical protein WN55_09847 [Dufourea novaeangliae]|uniref:Uncharacterized protein n=1 Tax=Dufourea novaeangliae TaxID=178035 RepID=A0A154P7M7_DUFNO|nr:hypothetical protein WN55_09847 [Dufourea novaeangliae]
MEEGGGWVGWVEKRGGIERTRSPGDIETKKKVAWTSAGGGGGAVEREASFDGPRVPGLPRDLTLTESQKWKRKDEPGLKRYRSSLARDKGLQTLSIYRDSRIKVSVGFLENTPYDEGDRTDWKTLQWERDPSSRRKRILSNRSHGRFAGRDTKFIGVNTDGGDPVARCAISISIKVPRLKQNELPAQGYLGCYTHMVGTVQCLAEVLCHSQHGELSEPYGRIKFASRQLEELDFAWGNAENNPALPIVSYAGPSGMEALQASNTLTQRRGTSGACLPFQPFFRTACLRRNKEAQTLVSVTPCGLSHPDQIGLRNIIYHVPGSGRETKSFEASEQQMTSPETGPLVN